MKIYFPLVAAAIWCPLLAEDAPISRDSKACIECHTDATPGIVADWRRSKHAHETPKEAMSEPKLSRTVSAAEVPEALGTCAVGCAECHGLNPKEHKDTFEHNGSPIHVIVTPKDCATCHPVERAQYEQNLMSRAHPNLAKNPVYHALAEAVTGLQEFDGRATALRPPDPQTTLESCNFCHGSAVEVKGLAKRDTGMGEMEFPILEGWPNQGVGRVNPDESMGSCAACHARHAFSIEVARKPYTCAECHKGPDVPAYRVYEVSKHGNIFASSAATWDFTAVPWRVGAHFNAPTCAACHVSLIATEGGEVIATRTHQMNDRSEWRLFGLIYAHPHPASPDTSIIRNKAGLALPTELTGEPVAEFLIDAKEREARRGRMQAVCLACHGSGWVDGRFAQLAHTVEETNRQTLAATKIMLKAWEDGAARGLSQNDSPFNETIEKTWTQGWLFYANSVRFSSAMCGADYGVFADGRWYLARTIQELKDWYELKRRKEP
jgi:hydroxylamine dehydrogenase